MRFLLEDKSLVCNQTLSVVEDKYLGRKGLKYVSSVQWEEEDESVMITKPNGDSKTAHSTAGLVPHWVQLLSNCPTHHPLGFYPVLNEVKTWRLKLQKLLWSFISDVWEEAIRWWVWVSANPTALVTGLGISQILSYLIYQDLNSIMTIRESVVNILYWDCRGKLSDNCYQWWPSRSQHLPTSLLSSSTLSSFSSQYST